MENQRPPGRLCEAHFAHWVKTYRVKGEFQYAPPDQAYVVEIPANGGGSWRTLLFGSRQIAYACAEQRGGVVKTHDALPVLRGDEAKRVAGILADLG